MGPSWGLPGGGLGEDRPAGLVLPFCSSSGGGGDEGVPTRGGGGDFFAGAAGVGVGALASALGGAPDCGN